jgi:hypothetical protein
LPKSENVQSLKVDGYPRLFSTAERTGFLSKKSSENEKTNTVFYGQARGDEQYPNGQDSKTNGQI